MATFIARCSLFVVCFIGLSVSKARQTLASLASLTSLITSPLFAQVLPEVTVTASQLPLTSTDLPATLSTFSAAELKILQPKNLGDLLSKSGLAFIREYGTSGLSNIAFRGSSSSQTAILLDGSPLNDPQIGFLDLKLLPANLFKQIEIQHGSGSALHGADAVGGIISLRTLAPFTPKDSYNIDINTKIGAFQQKELEANIELNSPNFQVRFFGGTKYNKGNFSYQDLSLIPAETLLRQNADFTTNYLFSGTGWKTKNRTHRLSTWMSYAHRGLATAIGSPPSSERQQEENARMWYESEIPTRKNRQLNVKLMLYGGEMLYTHPILDISDLGTHVVGLAQVGLHKIRYKNAIGVVNLQTQSAVANHPSLPNQARRRQFGATNSWIIHKKNTTLFPALRWDFYALENRNLYSLNPSLGWNKKLSEQKFLKASLGRSFRMPTLNDLYWRPGGNLNLKPELAWSLSGGFGFQSAAKQFEASIFTRKTQNEIVWTQGNSYWSPQNIRNTAALGLEIQSKMQQQLSQQIKWNSQLSGNFLKAVDVSDKTNVQSYLKQLRYIPQSQFGWMNQFSRKQSMAQFNLQFIGKRYTTSDQSQFLKAFVAADFSLQQQLSIGKNSLSTGFKIENLFNQIYQVYKGYPMPKRHLTFNLNLSFK